MTSVALARAEAGHWTSEVSDMHMGSTDHDRKPTGASGSEGGATNTEAIRSLLDVPNLPLEELIEQWSAARTRSLLATAAYQRPPEVDDLLSELTYATHIAREVISGRWCVVAQLLRAGADGTSSWAVISDAIGMTELQAKDGFHTWVASQNDLRHKTGRFGFTDTEANTLHHLAEAASW
ncbi:hypothetical protein ACIA8G_35400 [Lentzea sp. NPDC051213]|uniref:hypothetical protein n=1 Tax=Lentzea sp. NPDC051213 TaxID=3364126 RepID=UPI00378E26A1